MRALEFTRSACTVVYRTQSSARVLRAPRSAHPVRSADDGGSLASARRHAFTVERAHEHDNAARALGRPPHACFQTVDLVACLTGRALHHGPAYRSVAVSIRTIGSDDHALARSDLTPNVHPGRRASTISQWTTRTSRRFRWIVAVHDRKPARGTPAVMRKSVAAAIAAS